MNPELQNECKMQLADAVDLIIESKSDRESPETWADLGCGAGLFTRALAHILPEGSTIYAIDKLQQSVSQPGARQSTVKLVEADFETDDLDLPSLDGILMANSLHYVNDKLGLLRRLQKHLSATGMFIIIEYDSMQSNPWVPYPIDFMHLEKLFSALGFDSVKKLAERKSVYRQGNLYACAARRKQLAVQRHERQ